MNILMIITRGNLLGGGQIHVQQLATSLVASGHTVTVVTGSSGFLTGALAAEGIPIHVCPDLVRAIDPRRDARAVRELAKLIRRLQPDIVATHTTKAGIVGRLAAHWAGVPFISNAHGWAFTDGVPAKSQRLYRAVERLAAPLADKIICVSEHDRRIGIAAGIRADRQVTIHNGIPDIDNRFRSRPAGPGPVRVAMVARFDEQKDQRTLIRAAHGLENAHLDLVGDGPNIDAARRLADSLGMARRVSFHGARPDVPAVLSGVQVFALSSNWEGFPISTLEAMRSGLPVVVSDVGGAGEAVIEGKTGYLVPRGDVGALRDRLALLASQPEQRKTLGRAGRAFYKAEFTLDRMVARTLALYHVVAAGAGRAAPAHKMQEGHGGV